MAKVHALWRHPIKGHGREALQHVNLTEGRTMPWDRCWAVAHEATQADGTAWAPCANYTRAAKVPTLMAISSQLDEATGRLTLTHPNRPDLSFDPDTEAQAFLEWIRPLMPANRAQSVDIHRAPDRGMTDSEYPSVSLINLASGQDLGRRMKTDLSPMRWRGNIHLTGLEPWTEFDWTGKTLLIGTAELTVRESIERCLATTANPETGTRDADTLGALNAEFGHQNFGINAVVTRSGTLHVGDSVEVL